MKVHSINILMFSLPLNILVYNQRNHKSTTHHTPKIPTARLLCECELYAPANYDSDPEMKRVMQQFEDRTTQRFHEYDEKLQEKRQICKDKCDKEIQKIILKDKLEKELTEKLATLEANINTKDLPICECEKSIADKTEKVCLKCGYGLGSVAPNVGLIAEVALNVWKDAEIVAAIAAAKEAGVATGLLEGIEAGKKVVIGSLKKYFFTEKLGINSLDSYFTKGYYFDIENLAKAIYDQRNVMCSVSKKLGSTTCEQIGISIGTSVKSGPPPPPGKGPIVQRLEGLAVQAKKTADYVTETTTEKVTAEIAQQQTAVINATYTSWQIAITASVVAIVVIVLIMVIIYLILRYRRKKKMKKKLQYIKLLDE
ncbi:hypothetical protein PFAG_02235 [Plasmodium falciparum Santa Lucia]|uniref:Surface antigen n=1 Tax=Plasmodium falciparum Santa Lucia TaxID=478859 RepID=W7FIV4_PLAFA|nr:hypothetical protein PFAG_02235 [Plasmodium falciparum Santa Lucia]